MPSPTHPSGMLLSAARPGRSVRTALLGWQIGTLLLVILALAVSTVLFTAQYVTAQFKAVRQEQAVGILFNSDLPLTLQRNTDSASQDAWMTQWREASGAALLASWSISGNMAFDAESPELAQMFIDNSGAARQPDGDGMISLGGTPYYWRSETLVSGQNNAGRAVVAFALPSRSSLLKASARQLWPLLALALLLALGSALLLSQRLKRTLLDLEPADIAALTIRQGQLLSTVQDGVIGVDSGHNITVANAAATQTLGLSRLPTPLQPVWPELAGITPGELLRRQPVPLGGKVMLVSVTPLEGGGHLVAFTDRQEATRLAEQLTDTRRFVEAMRARAHEYNNRLHIIAGFLQLGQPAQALHAIQSELDTEATLGQALAYVADPRVAALLAGKVARAQELHLSLSVAPESEVPADLTPNQADALITALGNYIENAFEVLAGQEDGKITVDIGLDPDGLSAEVRDNGPGLLAGFDPFGAGHSSKGQERGYGLSSVAQLASALGGQVWQQRQGEWTVFGLNIPVDTDCDSSRNDQIPYKVDGDG